MENTLSSPLTPLRILLVEDDEEFAFSLTQALEKTYPLDYSKTEAEALRMLYIEDYDVLLLDLNLSTGYLSGFQFLDYVDRLDRFKNLVIIGISGMSVEDIKAHTSFEKLDAFLLKPVTRDNLIATIQQCTKSVKPKSGMQADANEAPANEEV